MARPLRIELSGGLYHVTARGDRREDIYFETADRLAWLDLLGVVCKRFNWVCHAYCLMTNHYHLVVETPEGNLAQGMRHLNGVYSQYINRTYRRVGHVFQGRYHAILVEKDSYLLELTRYVVLNPVRARMVSDAGEWAWSSYRAMVGRESTPKWLETDWVLGQYGSDRQIAIRAYIDFIRAGVGLPSLWRQLSNQIYLGSEEFVGRMQHAIESPASITEVPRAQRRPVAKPLERYSHDHDDVSEAMAAAYLSGDYSMKVIAEYFRVHYTTVSRAVKVRCMRRLIEKSQLQAFMSVKPNQSFNHSVWKCGHARPDPLTPSNTWRRGNMKTINRMFISTILALVAAFLFIGQTQAQPAPDIPKPLVIDPMKHDLSPPLRDIPPGPSAANPAGHEIPLLMPPLHIGPSAAAAVNAGYAEDTAVQSFPAPLAMPAPITNFEGVGNVFDVYPPDTNGDVGPNHYVQMVNLSFAIWDKSGNLLYGPVAGNTLWSGFGGVCETSNSGDPIVLYDRMADRWLLSQFALPNFPYGPFYQCIAVSRTGDPTGEWHRNAYLVSTSKMNDYPKFGVWPDGYYMSVNQFSAGSLGWAGQGVVVFERDKMLTGQFARMIYLDLYAAHPNLASMLPSHLYGSRLPPSGSPNYFVQVDDDGRGFSQDQLEIWRFQADWQNPAASAFTGPTALATAPFDSNLCNYNRSCIPQPGTASKLDTLADRLMYRLAYRNFDTHESLVVSHSVDVDGTDHAGVRWYEIRSPGGAPTIQQQGTYAPDANHRWMGSVAMDGSGNMALGYSVASSTVYPSIRYTGRLAGDPPGIMTQGETELIAGSGSQTGTASRWGDYSSMSVDAIDDCTFWYTTEYYVTTSERGWQTRIGSFKYPACSPPAFSLVSVTPPGNSVFAPIDGVVTAKFNKTVNAATLNSSTFLLKNGGTTIPATVTCNSPCTEARLTPSSTLAYDTLYSGSIVGGGGGIKDTGGAALASNYDWSFRTTPVPPTVGGFQPSDGTTNLPIWPLIFIYFSTEMDPASVNSNSFELTGPSGKVPSSVFCGEPCMIGFITPNDPLDFLTEYTASIVPGMRDANGTPMVQSYASSYTTRSSANNGADLVMTAVSSPASAVKGETIIIPSTIKNLGKGTAGGSTVGVYLSTDTVINHGDIMLGNRSAPGLAKNASDTADLSVTIPASLAPGTYYIGVIADSFDAVAERNETNNALAGNAISVAEDIDLVVSSVSGPSTADQGTAITITDTVANTGTVSTTSAFYILHFLSMDSVFDSSDTLISFRLLLNGLGAGETNGGSANGGVPSNQPPGTYYIIALVDSSNNVAESNESNNTLVGNMITITGTESTPSAPTNLTASAVSTSQINLNWTDTASNETEFKIELSTDGTSFNQIDTVAANVTSYSSIGLSRNKIYWYRVRASNASGDSIYSNTASAKTLKR